MSTLLGLHGTVALLVLALLLFVEEAGVPLPFVPGDILLLIGGLLIANRTLSPWEFFPVSLVAVMTGVLAGYTWSGLLGERGLHNLAARIGAAPALDRVAARLNQVGPLGILICRLLPGLRVYTTLVAGALRVDRRIFFLGVIPAVVVWIGAGTLAGYLIGVPAIHLLTHLERLLLDGAVLLGVGILSYLASRHIPPAETGPERLPTTMRLARLLLSLVVDAGVVITVVSGVTEIVRAALAIKEPDGVKDVVIVTAVMIVTYLILTRRGLGATAGERLLHVRYHPVRAAEGSPDRAAD